MVDNWDLYRTTYEGGDEFIRRYLVKYSERESPTDFNTRKCISYNPAFAEVAINEITNSIYTRMPDIARKNGSNNYEAAVRGNNRGVDLLNSSMDSFMGTVILPELVTMKKVGIYVDMPSKIGETLIDNITVRPYLYHYKAEDIINWDYDDSESPTILQKLVLREWYYDADDLFNMPCGEQKSRFRYLEKIPEGVLVRFYDDDRKIDTSMETPEFILSIDEIPFVICEITQSILKNIARLQIALLNMASSDLSYILRSNVPFYVEQYDENSEMTFLKEGNLDDTLGTVTATDVSKPKEIKFGSTIGRRYPLNADTPAFIHPSPEPLKVSMDKQEQIKAEIRILAKLALTNIKPKSASADSKAFDRQGLESGLSYLGLQLQQAENHIARIWGKYENKQQAEITYPTSYTLKSDGERIDEIEAIQKQILAVASKTYRHELMKLMAEKLLGDRLTLTEMQKIFTEIDKSQGSTLIATDIQADLEGGLISPEGASEIRGYNPDEFEKAKAAHIERLSAIAMSQAAGAAAVAITADGGPRGNKDQTKDPIAAKKEKAASQNPIDKPNIQPAVRGEGK